MSMNDEKAKAVSVTITDDTIQFSLADGRQLSAPLEWFPRLHQATLEERRKWHIIGDGMGIHWPEIDEDIAVSTLLHSKNIN